MNANQKLVAIKSLHTLIWLFFVVAIFSVLYGGIMDRVTALTWVAIALVVGEGIILLIFKMFCPLTVWARRYSSSTKDNFDIYLPNWLARHNKLIFTTLYILGLVAVLLRSFAQ